jgi:hypothetical protein
MFDMDVHNTCKFRMKNTAQDMEGSYEQPTQQ